MQVHDARVLRTAAIPAVVVGVVFTVASTMLVGSKGLVGAALGLVLVAAFFTASVVVVSWVARRNPMMMTNMALLTYLVKIVLLAGLLFAFRHAGFLDTKAFAWTVIACTLGWIGGESYAFARVRIPYVEPGVDR